MTPDERERMNILCQRIAEEKNHSTFTELVEQLNNLLDAKEQRLENRSDEHLSSGKSKLN